jgi:mycofactocin glycosyltransferase
MTQPRLPDGFAVQVDRSVRVLDSGAALLGGSPTRLLRLAPAARTLLADGRLEVRDAVSAQLARTLLDATVAHPRPAAGPSHRDVTVVIPVRDNRSGVQRLVAEMRGLRAIVVDDGSATVLGPEDFAGASCEVEVLRHPVSRGPAAARNTGLKACRTDFVAFLDSDVVPRRGWLEALLGHFCDPAVALVAPRIVGLARDDGAVARYEAIRSSLDLGQHEAPVVPYGPVAYVPSAAMVCRRAVIEDLGGFDEGLHSGEDVDLCWRLIEAGARLRYEPVALVAHEHRTELRNWLSRKAFYGSSAAPLAARHPDKTAPLVVSATMLVVWLLVAFGSRRGIPAAVLGMVVVARRIAKSLRGPETAAADVARVTGRGLWLSALQLASAACRHYWPVVVPAALLSRRGRRALAAAAVIDGVADWASHRKNVEDDVKPIGLAPYLLLKRLDDLAYGAGVWTGVTRERDLTALRPQIRS